MLGVGFFESSSYPLTKNGELNQTNDQPEEDTVALSEPDETLTRPLLMNTDPSISQLDSITSTLTTKRTKSRGKSPELSRRKKPQSPLTAVRGPEAKHLLDQGMVYNAYLNDSLLEHAESMSESTLLKKKNSAHERYLAAAIYDVTSGNLSEFSSSNFYIYDSRAVTSQTHSIGASASEILKGSSEKQNHKVKTVSNTAANQQMQEVMEVDEVNSEQSIIATSEKESRTSKEKKVESFLLPLNIESHIKTVEYNFFF